MVPCLSYLQYDFSILYDVFKNYFTRVCVFMFVTRACVRVFMFVKCLELREQLGGSTSPFILRILELELRL